MEQKEQNIHWSFEVVSSKKEGESKILRLRLLE